MRQAKQVSEKARTAGLSKCACGYTGTSKGYRAHQNHCSLFRADLRLATLMQQLPLEEAVPPPAYEEERNEYPNAVAPEISSTTQPQEVADEAKVDDAKSMEHTGQGGSGTRVMAQGSRESEHPVPTFIEESETSDDDAFDVESSLEDNQSEEVEDNQSEEADTDHEGLSVSKGPGKDDLSQLKLGLLFLKFGVSSKCVDQIFTWMRENESVSLPRSSKTFWRRFDKACQSDLPVIPTYAVINSGVANFRETKFHYVNPREAVVRLLSNRQVSFEQELLLSCDHEANAHGDRGELNSGLWWERTEAEVRRKFGESTRLLPIIFSTDSSHVSNKKSVKPVYLSLGIHKLKHRRSIFARECVAYIPDATLTSARYKVTAHNFLAKRIINLKCWQILLEGLDLDTPLEYTLPSGRVVRFGLAICYWVCDHPESQMLAQVKCNSTHSCRFCLSKEEDMAKLSMQTQFRFERHFEQALQGTGEDFSFYTDDANEFRILINKHLGPSSFSGTLGTHWALPMCALHVFLSQGLVKYVIEWCLEAIKNNGWNLTSSSTAQQIKKRKGTGEARKRVYNPRLITLDERFALVPSFSQRGANGDLVYMTRYTNGGISNLSYLTGRDYLCILQQLPFLIASSEDKLLPEYALEKFLKLFFGLHRMVFLVFKTSPWTQEVQQNFDTVAHAFARELTEDRDFVAAFSKTEMGFSKVHMLRHFSEMVNFYGAPGNFETGREEAAHKFFAKSAYKRTNRNPGFRKQMLGWSVRLKQAQGILSKNMSSLSIERRATRIRKYVFDWERKMCPGIALHQFVRFGLAAYLRFILPHMNISQERKQALADCIADKSLVVELTKKISLPGSEDVVTADYQDDESKSKHDFVELVPGPGGDRVFGKVQAFVHAMGSQFVILQHLCCDSRFQGTGGVNPAVGHLYIRHKVDKRSSDGTLWSIYNVSEILCKRNVIPDPDNKGCYFVNEMVML